MRKTGTYQKLGTIDYFIPYPLPPAHPSIALTNEIAALFGEASFNLGQLNEKAAELPDPRRFIKAYVIKEALLSSAIEGIHTTLLDVYTQPLGGTKPSKETQLVLNYTKALERALIMMKDDGMPISSRLILAAHETLMSACNEDHSDPGHYRKQAVRVGNLIPPPAQEITTLMSDLEAYINNDNTLPPLINAGLAHVQFETIHPFLDGNGRIGRLLIVLILIDRNFLSIPILYPSYYFKKHHQEYYYRLDRVRTAGDFEGWITYYLKAIRDSSQDAYKRAKDIELLEKDLIFIIQQDPILKKMGESATEMLEILFRQPFITTNELSSKTNKSYNTAYKAIKRFSEIGILKEAHEHGRERIYQFEAYMKLLEKEY